MRFTRRSRSVFTDTPRKRAAYGTKCRREQDALPLFAVQIADEQVDVDTEMARRSEAWEERTKSDRAWRATKWREARALLQEHPDKAALLARWQTSCTPADPPYLLTLIEHWNRGSEWARKPLRFEGG